MVTTYNHEINNPLTISLMALKKLEESGANVDSLDKLKRSLLRINEIVKKIREISENAHPVFI